MDTALTQPSSTDPEVEKLINRLSVAVQILYMHVPFWGMLLENLSVYCTRAVPTAAVDARKNELYLNPDFLNGMSDAHFAFVLSHEVAHVAFNSHGRTQWRDKLLWNVASDFSINSILKASFKTIPGSALYDAKYDDMSTEEIYELLPEDFNIIQGPSTEIIGQNGESVQGDTPGDMYPEVGEDEKQKIKAGSKDQDDSDNDSDKKNGSGKPQKPVDWNAEMTKALTHAKMQGKVSQEFERKLAGGADHQVDWKAVLRQKVSHLLSRDGRDDFTYMPPNRRYLHQDIIMPSSVGHRDPVIAYSIDTSGSMSDEELTQGMAEVDAIRQLFQAKLYFIVCDYEVTEAQWIDPYEDMPTLKGGGGTSFVPIFDKLEQDDIECDALIVFTDGYGTFPQSDKGYDTIWIMTSTVTPPFGECVNVKIPTRCS